MPKSLFDHTVHLGQKRDRIRARNDGGTLTLPRSKVNLIEGTGIDITVADNPTSDQLDITIASASVQDPPLGPDGNRKWKYRTFQDISTTTLSQVGTGAPNTASIGAAVSNQNTSSGSFLEYTSDALINNPAGWVISTQQEWQTQLLPDSTWYIMTPATVTNFRAWIGSSVNALTGTDTPVGESIAFRYSTGTSDTNWRAITTDSGSNITNQDTGVAFAASTVFRFRTKVVSTGSVEFYINGVLVATSTSTLPTSTTNLKCTCASSTLSNTNKRWRVSYQYWTML